MKVIDPGFEILTEISEDGIKELQHIEKIARRCYKSEDKITEDGESAKKMVANLIKRKHFAMIEHGSVSVLFTVDRGVSHELVRHRMASFAQESTRYCNYAQGKFGGELTFIRPFFFTVEDDPMKYGTWATEMSSAEHTYLELLKNGASPQEARSVLPNSLKTEIIMTANYREWRHFFELRALGTTGQPHPQMKQVAVPLLREFQKRLPILFDDLQV